MRNVNRPNEDEEIEALRRSMRPDQRRIIAVLAAVLIFGLGGLAYAVSRGFANAEEHWRHGAKPATSSTNDSPFISANRRLNAPHAVARQAVAIHTGRSPEPNGVFSQGSGFLMADGMVITAAHVLTSIAGGERGPVYVRCNDAEHKGTVAALDAVRDVAAVATPGCNGRVVRFRHEWISAYEGLHVAGYDFAPESTSSQSQWFQVDTSLIPTVVPYPNRPDIEPALAQRLVEMEAPRHPPYFAIAGELMPGNSGSAVFDDEGHVVGMLVAADSRFNRSYCVPSTVIVDTLRNNGIPLP